MQHFINRGFNADAMFLKLQICMPNIDDMMASSNPFLYLLLTSTGSRALTTFIGAGLILLNMGCNMSVFSSASRLTWAWARDGGCKCFFELALLRASEHWIPYADS